MKNQLLLFLLVSTIGCFAGEKNEIDRVPEWAKEAIWYQIFPERFNNGDKSNDPGLEDVVKGWPFIKPDGWEITPWTSDWYKRQPYEEKLTEYDFYQINGMRRYGGDLQGVIDKLDYLVNLGVNAIYFNPIFEAPSLHKYDATMYRHIDNNFGPDPQGDIKIWESENPVDPRTWKWTSADKLFLKLLTECKKRDIKVIIDGVFNHVGTTFWAFQDIVENQENSEFKDWIDVISWDDPLTKKNEFDYEGWIGIKSLPELKEDENGLITPIKNHIFNIVNRWMDPNGDGDPSDGIDGWRLDVAEMVNINFWKEFRIHVKSINPDAYITGEIWWEDWNRNKMFNAAPWLEGDAFDAVMNYRFARALRKFIINKDSSITAFGFVDTMKQIQNDYHPENLKVIMNLMDSHDVDRLASQIVNPDEWYDHRARTGEAPDYSPEAPDSIGRLKQKLVVAMQMTLPGAPMIYYGDEAGMWGGDDPDCRKPMVWPEHIYDDESHHPFNEKRKTNKVYFNEELFEWYKKLINLRKSYPLLSLGTLEFKPINDNLLLYKRSLKNKELTILVNKSDQIKLISQDQVIGKSSKDYLELIENKFLRKNEKNLLLNPFQILILE
jgi:cyclomaltodextrinase